jgi:hypothetical protein
MEEKRSISSHDDAQDFMQQAELAQPSLLREYWEWLRDYRKWWLIPIVLTLLLVGLMVIASSTAVAPFIYTLF